jgi:cation diffusion facilitator family transporter
MAGGGHGTKAVVAALLANSGIAIAKFVGFAITRSSAMLAESVHSVADAGNQALLLLGHRRAQQKPTPQHPFGYGRERYFWSFVVAVILFSLGGMFALYEGVEKIRHPHELESPAVAVAILTFGIILEIFSFRTAIVEANHVKAPKTSWWSFVRRSKTPELPVVLLEDLAALVGLIVALLSVSVSIVTDDPIYDGIGTLAIGVLLVVVATILAIEMKGLLIGEAASPSDEQAIAAAIEVEPSVTRLIHMRTQHIGPDELLVGAKIELVPGLSVTEVTDAVNRVETAVRRAVPAARVMYLEPDVFRTSVPPEGVATTSPSIDTVDLPDSDVPDASEQPVAPAGDADGTETAT